MKKFLKKWSTVIVLSLALAIIIIDSTVLNVSLRNLITDLNTDIKSLQTVITTYSLVMAAFLITGGRLGDIFGRKKMFLVGAITFGIGSLVASFSQSVPQLLIGWSIIEGIGAALMMPATSSLLLSAYKGKDRALAFGIWGGIAGASSALGPLLGGWITNSYSWRWAFRINPIIVVLLILLSGFILEYKEKNIDRHLDYVGIFLSALGLSSIVYPIIESSKYGWWTVKEQLVLFGNTLNTGNLSVVPIFMLIGIIILIGFYFWEKKVKKSGKTPLIDIEIFRNFQFTSGLTTLTIIVLGQMGLFFSMPVFLQAVKGFNAFETGKAFLPLSLTTLIVAPLSAKMTKKIAPKYIIIFGVAMSIIGAYLLRNTLSVDMDVSALTTPLIFLGLGMGAVMAQISNLTLSAVSTQKAGEASGVLSTIRNVGSSLGAAIIGSVFLTALASGLISGAKTSETLPNEVKNVIEVGANEDASKFEFGLNESPQMRELPVPVKDEVKRVVNVSIVDGNKKALTYTIWFMFIALISSLFLPKMEVKDDKNVNPSH